MKNFKDYLIVSGITPGRQIAMMIGFITIYLDWLKIHHLDIRVAKYKDLLGFIGFLQENKKSAVQINKSLQTISHYYQHQELDNIAQSIRLKGMQKSQPQNLLSSEDLDLIFSSFKTKKTKGFYHFSDPLILGLIIYQALDMQEFLNLKLKDLDLEKGQIYIGAYRQKQSRVIPLKAHQILSLHSFILQLRSCFARDESNRLFSPQADNYHLLHDQFKRLNKEVKKQIKLKTTLKIDKLSQLRQSRIAIWIKEYGLRKTQYLAGFKRVSSVERYQKADLSDLKKQVQIHHPLQ